MGHRESQDRDRRRSAHVPPQFPWAQAHDTDLQPYAIALTSLATPLGEVIEHAARWNSATPGDATTSLCGIGVFVYPGPGAEPWQAPWPFDPERACQACVTAATAGP